MGGKQVFVSVGGTGRGESEEFHEGASCAERQGRVFENVLAGGGDSAEIPSL